MKILVTGANGFIGQKLCQQLNQQHIDYVTLGRNKPGTSQKTHIPCDLLKAEDFNRIVRASGASHLIHLAWYTEHGKYWQSAVNRSWYHASMELVEAFIRAGGQHVTITGTCAEYDWRYGFCNEQLTPLRCESLYSEYKNKLRCASEALCDEHGVTLAWARVFFCYGDGENPARLIPSLRQTFRGKQAPFGVNLDVYRDFIDVHDTANALCTLTQCQAAGCYNISSAQPLLLRTLVELIAHQEHADATLVTRQPPQRQENFPLLVGDNRKLKELGWQPLQYFQHHLAHSHATLRSAANE